MERQPHHPSRAQRAGATREKILHAAFLEFFRQAFQGGNLSRILAAAGVTKGGLFHHFAGKTELGYAVVDEVIGPLLAARWLAPVAETDDPIPALQAAFRRHVQDDLDSGHWKYGCPLNNLAQEMAPLDAGFHTRINRLYDDWRAAWAAALERGQGKGTVKSSASAASIAALLVAGQMGIRGTGKSSQNRSATLEAVAAICDYLESLKPRRVEGENLMPTLTMTDRLLDELRAEAPLTRRALERIPDEHLAWKPHPKSLSLGQLALHIAVLPWGIPDLVTEPIVEAPEVPYPQPANRAEVLETFDRAVEYATEKMEGWGDEGLEAEWKLTMGGQVILAQPRADVLRTLLFNQLYHHRGQLTVYLRLLGVPVPPIYGPSADESPFG